MLVFRFAVVELTRVVAAFSEFSWYQTLKFALHRESPPIGPSRGLTALTSPSPPVAAASHRQSARLPSGMKHFTKESKSHQQNYTLHPHTTLHG
jgi:hypothetical protein